nr:response regulator [uncultured Desulfobulbus sp.]
MNQLTTLIIEGNEASRKQIKKALETTEEITTSIIEAESLAHSVGLIPHYDIDVVLLNCELPDSQGFNTLRTIIATLPEAAIIIIADSEDQNKLASLYLHYGAQDYLECRNVSCASLQRAIHYGVDRKRFLQEKNDLLCDLNDALDKISTLETYLPICCGCSKILGEDNRWHRLDEYHGKVFIKKSELQLCPVCTDDKHSEA